MSDTAAAGQRRLCENRSISALHVNGGCAGRATATRREALPFSYYLPLTRTAQGVSGGNAGQCKRLADDWLGLHEENFKRKGHADDDRELRDGNLFSLPVAAVVRRSTLDEAAQAQPRRGVRARLRQGSADGDTVQPAPGEPGGFSGDRSARVELPRRRPS